MPDIDYGKGAGKHYVPNKRPGFYRCPGCGVSKTDDEYYADRARWNGCCSRCKDCTDHRVSVRNADRWERGGKRPGRYRCPKCGDKKGYHQYYGDRTRWNGCASTCMNCDDDRMHKRGRPGAVRKK